MAKPTATLAGPQVAERIGALVPDGVEEAAERWVFVRRDRLIQVAQAVHDDRELDGRYLNSIAGIDRHDHFEVAYHLTSLSHNHTFALKVRTADHDEPEVPSVVSVWHGAHLQEREVFDLMGVRFAGHPTMKRLFLWEGFPGYPLRKDFRSLPGGFNPGLQRFPKEEAGVWGGEARVD